MFRQVNNLNSILNIEVKSKNTSFGGDITIGFIIIPMTELKDQEQSDSFYDLQDASGNMIDGRIRMIMQLVWSRYNYFQKKEIKTEKQLKILGKDIEEINKYLNLVEKPFGIILYGEVINLLENKLLYKSESLEQYSEYTRKSVYATRDANPLAVSLADKFENAIIGTFRMCYTYYDRQED